MDAWPELSGSESLDLRWATPADAADIAASIDDEVVRAFGWDEEERRLAVVAMTTPSGAWATRAWLARDARTGSLVACTEVTREPARPGTGVIGIWVAPAHRGQGLATEVLRLVLANQAQAGYERLELATAIDNLAMQRAALAAGAREVERYRHTLPDGEVVDAIRYRWDDVSPGSGGGGV